ncbi:hypothetical protein B0J18DRAFT_236348 [Chaetomium sp. MPI-SDFR-AT-0129]|nr:hypothetical protein B0J18DRAFT_236348 [Chaetomium sp. MPI-SDFR-AT-0129]
MGFSKKPTDTRAADPIPMSTSTSDDPSSSNSSASFFSRFALPLRSRARYIADFHVRPAEPHRKYVAGDQVQGAVVLTVVKPIRITHLVVSLHGYMRVYKGPNAPANEPIVDPAEAFTSSGRSKHLGNSCLRLFQDEQTLSGDGRLEPGKYEFNFNLLFPSSGLPSSIDFERGTISYMITATLTRPASMGTKVPLKISCERKVQFSEMLDIGTLAPPRPRIISLDPVAKRPKKKKQGVSSAGKSPAVVETIPSPSEPEPEPARVNENSTDGSLSVIGEEQEQEQDPAGNNPPRPQSEVRSVSSGSAASGSTSQSKAGDPNHVTGAVVSFAGKQPPAAKDRTITATVELPKRGCLRGDTVPIKVSVQHNRCIKSMHGIVVTLYRMGRIDSSPPALFKGASESEARRLEKEEYFPRSKTGLGGLSLTSAGPCSVFRKDLSQTFAPLIIDPDTLTANLTASVRVPEDVFPTIQGAPYDMISFGYRIEVIVDLGGKLSSQLHAIKPSNSALGVSGSAHEGTPGTVSSWGTNIIDTDTLRRQKGVVPLYFEIVVGTVDSSRLRAKASAKPHPSSQTVVIQEPETYESPRAAEKQPWPATPDHAATGQPSEPYVPQDYTGSPHTQPQQPYPYWGASPPDVPPAPHYVPPPQVPDEGNLTEKERIRQAEQRLLPSQPPEVDIAGPSQPHTTPDENIYDADDQIPTPTPGLSHSTSPPQVSAQQGVLGAPSAPTLEDLSSNVGPSAVEDKQELERRRLLAEASAPPEFPDDYNHGASGSTGPSAPLPNPGAPPSGHDLPPSAPVLEDEDAYGPHYAYGTPPAEASSSAVPVNVTAPEEPLPAYER